MVCEDCKEEEIVTAADAIVTLAKKFAKDITDIVGPQ